jgi:phosphate transport system substrate-binding protein
VKIMSFALAAGLAVASLTTTASAADITGAGATFPFPVYSKWAEAYKKETGNGMNYQSIGSGGGIKQIQAKTVDFGATDAPMKGADLDKNGLLQFPTVMGGVVPVVNIDGLKAGELVLDGPALAKIFLGEIKSWNDPVIQKLNANAKLPNQPIVVVHRSDGSGTSFLFTDYLSKVSPDWKSKVGANTAVEWPTGIGAKGNEGVANNVGQTKGSIGYVEYAYAKQNNIPYALLQNKAGKYPQPEIKSFQAAAASADWSSAPGFGISLTNQAGDDAWPITNPTFILVYKTADKPEQTAEVLKFFDWAYKNGDKLASDLDYVPLPDNVVEQIRATWAKDIKDGSGKAVYKM